MTRASLRSFAAAGMAALATSVASTALARPVAGLPCVPVLRAWRLGEDATLYLIATGCVGVAVGLLWGDRVVVRRASVALLGVVVGSCAMLQFAILSVCSFKNVPDPIQFISFLGTFGALLGFFPHGAVLGGLARAMVRRTRLGLRVVAGGIALVLLWAEPWYLSLSAAWFRSLPPPEGVSEDDPANPVRPEPPQFERPVTSADHALEVGRAAEPDTHPRRDTSGRSGAAESATDERKACAITVAVIASGAPVKGAEVTLLVGAPGDGDWDAYAWAASPGAYRTTGVDGTARFPRVDRGRYKLLATTPGYTTASTPQVECDPHTDAQHVTIVLSPVRACVRGRVVDRERRPLASSWLVLERAKDLHSDTVVPVILDPEGRFTACTPEPADIQWHLLAGAVGYETRGLSVDDQALSGELTVELERQSVISGVVLTPEGPAAGGVMVSVSSRNPLGSSTVVSEVVDEKGSFHLVTGPHAATVSALGHGMWAEIELPERFEGDDPEDLVVVLQPGRAISGVARTPTGEPVGSVRVCFQPVGMQLRACKQADAAGRFKMRGIPPDRDLELSCVEDSRFATGYAQLVRAVESEVDLIVVPPTN